MRRISERIKMFVRYVRGEYFNKFKIMMANADSRAVYRWIRKLDEFSIGISGSWHRSLCRDNCFCRLVLFGTRMVINPKCRN